MSDTGIPSLFFKVTIANLWVAPIPAVVVLLLSRRTFRRNLGASEVSSGGGGSDKPTLQNS